MMLLQELTKLHDRIEEDIGPLYHREDEINWIVQLSSGGEFEQLIEAGGRSVYRADRVRTVNVAPYLVVDKPYYVLGLNLDRFDDEQKVEDRHNAYVELITECHKDTGDPYVGAIKTFLKNHVQEARNSKQVEDMNPNDMVTFRVVDELVHELEAVKNFWIEKEEQRSAEDSSLEAECLVCGEEKPIAQRHPIGSQLGQAGLISANEDAFESYGLKHSEIAPVCQRCAQSYGRALRYLFNEGGHHTWIAGIAFSYWTEKGTGTELMNMLTEPDPQAVEELIESPLTGRNQADNLDNKFYALTATTNQSRIIVRDWMETTLSDLKSRLAQFFRRQRMIDSNGELGRVASVYSLAGSLVRNFDDLPPDVIPALLNNALKGTNLPKWLLNEAVNRAHADTENRMTHPRAALIKMVLNQDTTRQEGIKMSEKLDLNNENPAYLCGRLLSVLENIQRTALGGDINTTIVDQFYGTASSSPVSVFGNLLRKGQNHLSKIKGKDKGAHSALQQELEEILSKLDGFPKTLNYEEQGQFSLGYYHQKAESRAQAIEQSRVKEEAEEN